MQFEYEWQIIGHYSWIFSELPASVVWCFVVNFGEFSVIITLSIFFSLVTEDVWNMSHSSWIWCLLKISSHFSLFQVGEFPLTYFQSYWILSLGHVQSTDEHIKSISSCLLHGVPCFFSIRFDSVQSFPIACLHFPSVLACCPLFH